MSKHLRIAVASDEKGFFHMFQVPCYGGFGETLIADEGDGEQMYTVVSDADFNMNYDEEQVKLLFAATNVNLPLHRATAFIKRCELEFDEDYDYKFEEEIQKDDENTASELRTD